MSPDLTDSARDDVTSALSRHPSPELFEPRTPCLTKMIESSPPLPIQATRSHQSPSMQNAATVTPSDNQNPAECDAGDIQSNDENIEPSDLSMVLPESSSASELLGDRRSGYPIVVSPAPKFCSDDLPTFTTPAESPSTIDIDFDPASEHPLSLELYNPVLTATNVSVDQPHDMEEMVKTIVDENTSPDHALQLVEQVVGYIRARQDFTDQVGNWLITHMYEHPRYQALCKDSPVFKTMMDGILNSYKDSSSRLATIANTQSRIKNFVGNEFYNAFLEHEMAPHLATYTWSLCKFVYNNELSFMQVFHLLNRVRAMRIRSPPSRGVSPNPRLMVVDINRTKELITAAAQQQQIRRLPDRSIDINLRTLCPVTDPAAIVECGERMRAAGHPSLLVDKGGIIHIGSQLPTILENKSEKQFPTPAQCVVVDHQGRMVRRKTDSALSIQPSPPNRPTVKRHRESPPDDLASVAPSPTKKQKFQQPATTRLVRILPTRKANPRVSMSAVPLKLPASQSSVSKISVVSSPTTSQVRTDVVRTIPLQRQWRRELSLAEYRLHSRRPSDPVRLLAPDDSHSGGENAPPLHLPSNLAAQLFENPNRAERLIIDWADQGHRLFTDASNPAPASWAAHMETSLTPTLGSEGAITEAQILSALGDINTAVMPYRHNDDDDHANSTMPRPDLPWYHVYGLAQILYGIHTANQMRLPVWAESIREQIHAVIKHYGEDHSAEVSLGLDQIGRDICVRPSSLTMAALVVSPYHRGWIATGLLFPVIQYLTSCDPNTQVLQPDDWADYHQRRQVKFPRHSAPTSTSIVLLPLNTTGEHWSLLALNFGSKTYHHFDSLGLDPPKRQFLASVLDGLTNTSKAGKEWRLVRQVSQLQKNYADCGFWVIANAISYSRTGHPAGPQTTAGLRTWVTTQLSEVLLGRPSSLHAIRISPAPWVTSSMDTVADLINEAQSHNTAPTVTPKSAARTVPPTAASAPVSAQPSPSDRSEMRRGAVTSNHNPSAPPHWDMHPPEIADSNASSGSSPLSSPQTMCSVAMMPKSVRIPRPQGQTVTQTASSSSPPRPKTPIREHLASDVHPISYYMKSAQVEHTPSKGETSASHNMSPTPSKVTLDSKNLSKRGESNGKRDPGRNDQAYRKKDAASKIVDASAIDVPVKKGVASKKGVANRKDHTSEKAATRTKRTTRERDTAVNEDAAILRDTTARKDTMRKRDLALKKGDNDKKNIGSRKNGVGRKEATGKRSAIRNKDTPVK